MKTTGLAFLFLLLSFGVYAADDSPPLWPGTKIIAGDVSKNEFFIVAQNDIPRIVKSLSKNKSQPSNASPANQQAKNHSSKIIPKLKMALQNISKKKNKPAKKIFLTDSKQTNCLNNKSHQKYHKKNLRKFSRMKSKNRKINVAVHRKSHQTLHKAKKKFA